MPSPFPGMDPYLESPQLWPDVHHGLISEIRATLNRQLAPRYRVGISERIYVADECDPGRQFIFPDLLVSNSDCAVIAEPIVVTTLLDEEIHDAYLEVIDTSLRQVVTVIEILSPINKCAGSKGRNAFLKKREEVMRSPSHLVEIDLLRNGESITAWEMLPDHEYLVHLSRAQKRPQAVVWPIRLHQRLPVIDIPLRPEDPDAKLDLQTVLNTAYDRAAYDLQIDYKKDPTPPLSGKLPAWAKDLLTEKGAL